jgi:tetratricopeptide (TPR) repeat protein
MVPDYYARLGIDSGAGRAEIEAALARMQPAWSMGTRNPKTRHTHQLYLDEIPALRKALLGDPTTRAAYDAELAMTQVAEKDRKLDELQRRVRLRSAKGGLTASDRKYLSDEAAKLGLSEDDLARLARPIPDLVEAVSVDLDIDLGQGAPTDVLDPSTRRQIQTALEHLGCRDLYDALGVSVDAPASYLAARADAERQRWMKKSQVTAEKTAWLEVISHAQSHLASSKARARYDRTLTQQAEEIFAGLVEFTVKGLTRLDPSTHAALLEEAAAAGVVGERADRLIGRACRRAGVSRERGSVTPLAGPTSAVSPGGSPALGNGATKYSLLRCRQCSGVTEQSPVARKSGAARCRHCGASLNWNCPVCKHVHWVDERRCSCGFRQALREPLMRHFDAAQNAFRLFEFERALEHLNRVLEFAPNFAVARNGLAKIQQRQSAIARARTACETARAGGRLVAARRAAEAWGRLADSKSPDLRAVWTELTRELERAEALAASARDLERSDPARARELYRQSLAVAADLPEALAGLKRTPPDPPTALDAQVTGDRIRLWWSPPPPDGLGPLTYIVVRKRGGTLQHPSDGTRIAEVSTSEYDDMHVPPGETVAYAVIAKRSGAESVTAISLGPFVFLADVKDVRVEAHHDEVDLTWTLPRGISEVRLIRKRGGPPKSVRDGDRLPSALDHARDRTVDPEELYFYGVYAVYAMPDGRLYPSPGVIVSARPHSPVAPPDAPRLLQEPTGRIRIDCLEPARGSVRIIRTVAPFSHPVGSRLTAADVEALQGRWIESAGGDRAYDPDPLCGGICFYTPLAGWAGTWTVGQSAALSRVADPRELRATRAGGGSGGMRVTLRWRWPADVNSMLVVARQGTPPHGPDDADTLKTSVARADYDRLESWTLTLPVTRSAVSSGIAPAANGSAAAVNCPAPDAGPWHIRVYGAIEADGRVAFSPGLEPTASTVLPGPNPEVTVSYVLKRPWLPGRAWSVTFHTEPSGTAIPPMVLVAHHRAVPLSATDGQIVARFPAARDGARFPINRAVSLAQHSARVFLDPNTAPDDLFPVRLRHPEAGVARL